MQIEMRLADVGLVLPEPLVSPPGVQLPFPWVRVRGRRDLWTWAAADRWFAGRAVW